MKDTTLCYIEKDGAYLLLHRTKKENDINHDKWIGVGGKLENGETPFDCAMREIKEETGVTPINLEYRGIVKFISDLYGTEIMHLFTANDYIGDIAYNCKEGELVWIKKDKITSLPIWEGDKIFLELLNTDAPFFRLELNYRGDQLISHKLY